MTLEVRVSPLSISYRLRSPGLQSYSYSTGSIHQLILRLFEKYVSILEVKFGKRFESVSSLLSQRSPTPLTRTPDRGSRRLPTNVC